MHSRKRQQASADLDHPCHCLDYFVNNLINDTLFSVSFFLDFFQNRSCTELLAYLKNTSNNFCSKNDFARPKSKIKGNIKSAF